jgi:hypothetical protein
MFFRYAILPPLVLLQACQPMAPVVKPSVKPTVCVTPTAAPKAAPALLQRPSGNVSVMAGQIALDANYIVAQGGGNIISTNGAGLVGNSGGTVVAAGDQDLAVDQGNAIISNDGASIISTNGAGIISTNGAGIISTNGAGYALAAAPAVPVGQVLPVAGAQLGVRSLVTGQLLPLGKDAQGNDVTTIVSNRQGRFELYLPATEVNNVRVEAAFRTSGGQVQRYGVLTPSTAGTVAVDEDTQLVTQYITDAFSSRLESIMTLPPEVVALNKTIQPFLPQLEPSRTAVATLPPEKAKLAIRRCAEQLMALAPSLGHVPVYDLPEADATRMATARARNEERQLPTSSAVAVDVFRAIRRAVVARMRLEANPEAYFDDLPQLKAYRAAMEAGFHFRHATDFTAFLTRAYLASALEDEQGDPTGEKSRFNGIEGLLEGLPMTHNVPVRWQGLFPPVTGVDQAPALAVAALGPDAIPPGETYRLSSGTRAVIAALIEQVFFQEGADQLRARLLEIIQSYK